MSLPSPNLDDRDWRQLMASARRRIQQQCAKWKDLSPSDPGTVLVELFAHLTETLIFRTNRIPEKVHVELLNLLGVSPRPPHAASVQLELRRSQATPKGPVRVPRGTRVTTAEGTPVFRTLEEVVLDAAQAQTSVRALHAESEVLTPIGEGNGRAGLVLTIPRAPLARGPEGVTDLAIYVEAGKDAAHPDVEVDGRAFERWREVADFATTAPTDRVFLVDRTSGTVRFAPALALERTHAFDAPPDRGAPPVVEALAAIPGARRQVRASVLRGGGSAGNVLPGTLTVMLDPVADLQVTNPEAATGGADVETLEHALQRGPVELRNPERTITATDYERAALRCRGVAARARAFTQRDLWLHALPGTVEVVLVPTLPPRSERAVPVAASELLARQSAEGLARVQAEIEPRRPLGTRCVVSWAGYKTVRVLAKVVVQNGRDLDEVRAALVARLHAFLHPLTGGEGRGWRFGQSLHVSHVYRQCLAEAGVIFVDAVELSVEEAPTGAVSVVAADPQPHVWFLGNARRLFRSLNDGTGWEVASLLPEGHEVTLAAAHPRENGCVALVAKHAGGALIRVSLDCGGTWPIEVGVDYTVNAVAWTQREGEPVLLLATSRGLASLRARLGEFPELTPDTPDLPVLGIAVSSPREGTPSVALGTRHGGVWLSRENGIGGSFVNLGAEDADVREVAFQEFEGRVWLWAALFTIGDGDGEGVLRWELGATRAEPTRSLERCQAGWNFGSCLALAFVADGRKLLAGTSKGLVVELDTKSREPEWRRTSDEQGLPFYETGLKRVDSLAAKSTLVTDDQGRPVRQDHVLVGGEFGLYRSRDAGAHFTPARQAEDLVTLPQTWLFCSGDHRIEVVHERSREPSSRLFSSEERAP